MFLHRCLSHMQSYGTKSEIWVRNEVGHNIVTLARNLKTVVFFMLYLE